MGQLPGDESVDVLTELASMVQKVKQRLGNNGRGASDQYTIEFIKAAVDEMTERREEGGPTVLETDSAGKIDIGIDEERGFVSLSFDVENGNTHYLSPFEAREIALELNLKSVEVAERKGQPFLIPFDADNENGNYIARWPGVSVRISWDHYPEDLDQANIAIAVDTMLLAIESKRK
jgi:hypothetical protein